MIIYIIQNLITIFAWIKYYKIKLLREFLYFKYKAEFIEDTSIDDKLNWAHTLPKLERKILVDYFLELKVYSKPIENHQLSDTLTSTKCSD